MQSLRMRPSVTDVAWSVCPSVGLSRPYRNRLTDPGAVWGFDSGWLKEARVRWRPGSPRGRALLGGHVLVLVAAWRSG